MRCVLILTNQTEKTKKKGLPGFVVGDEWVSVCLRVSTEGVGGTQVSRAARTPPVAGLAAFLLSRHAFQ